MWEAYRLNSETTGSQRGQRRRLPQRHPRWTKPAAISRQNRHRFSRCHTGGRPSEDNFCRVDRSDFRLPVTINTSMFGVLRRPVESTLRAAVGMMSHARRRLSPVNGRLQGCHRQPCVDRPTDGVTDDQPRPGIEDDGDVDETGRQGDIGDIADPKLVGTARNDILRQVREDRTSWSLSVVAMKRRLIFGLRSCSRMTRRIFLWFTIRPC